MPKPKIKLAVDNGDTTPNDALFVTLQEEFNAVIVKHCVDSSGKTINEKMEIAALANAMIAANIISQTACCLGHLLGSVARYCNEVGRETGNQFNGRQQTIH